MEQHINKAVKLYSGDKPLGLFADRLENNLKKLNALYNEIAELFENAKIENFEKLPNDLSERGEFAKLFKKFNDTLEASKIQGFKWGKHELNLDENTYLILVQRYKELSSGGGGGGGSAEIPFDIEGYITQIDTDKIDTDFMNSRFSKYFKTLAQGDAAEAEKTLNELHKSFATLSQEEQKYANIFIHDIQNGDVQVDPNKTFKEYITEYQANAKNSQVKKLVELFGLDANKLQEIMNTAVSEQNLNDYGRFDSLKSSVDKDKAKEYFEALEGAVIPPFKIGMKVHNLLKEFILKGGDDL